LSIELEICVDSVESAVAASRGGADRVELCSALSEGGITPSIGAIKAVRDAIGIGVFIIIRPRGGDFFYSEHEFDVMKRDIYEAKALGVDGVVLGLLTAEDKVDIQRTRELIELARPMQVTFHRAFDVSNNLMHALEDVIACGADRVLTSGGEVDAYVGVDRIAELCQVADGRIRIMPGCGIRLSNVREIVGRTGAGDIHTSLTAVVENAAVHRNLRVKIGFRINELTRPPVIDDDVREFRDELQSILLGVESRVSIK
jgi:copper homeostasis protein